MLSMRPAWLQDVDFLLQIDLKDEGSSGPAVRPRDEWELAAHKARMRGFVQDEDKGALLYEETESGRRVGLVMYLFRSLDGLFYPDEIIPELDRGLFPPDGRFAEVFQLWVHPDFRRRGMATVLKLQVEAAARARGVGAVYTHTEERNAHVIELNRKLGYQEVRRGPIWDAVVRVSLIKRL